MKKKVYFRADADQSIGYGHFIRSLALADMLKEDFNCTFYTVSPTEYQVGELEKVCKYIVLNSDTPFEDFLDILQGDEIVLLDNYFYTTDYQQAVKAKGCKLVCIDDMHNKHYLADVVINHGLYDTSLFSVEPYTKLALGFDYALLRKPFLTEIENNNKEKGHWFLSFGGSDYGNFTAKFAGFLEASNSVKSVTAVIGDAYRHLVSLQSFRKIEIKKNMSASQMQYEMSRAEYAVLPSSSVCIEALACGCKIASGYYVDNQMEFYNKLAGSKQIFPLGNLNEYKGNTFIKALREREFPQGRNFSEIPSNYIQLFRQI